MAEHVQINRDFWDGMAEHWIDGGERLWALDTPQWGIWGTPDAKAPMLPDDMTGMTAIELGCGTGYVSGWMARRGAAVTGLDVSPKQLDTARRLAAKHQIEVTFLEESAEATSLPDASFDVAISEYGAAIWCDPDLWLREAHRLLKPGGKLSFLGNHPLMIITTPENGDVSDLTLHRPYRNLGRLDWTDVEIDPGGVTFNRTIAGWVQLFNDIGFKIIDYRELYAQVHHTGGNFPVTADWAREYPAEQVWWLEKRS